MTMYPREMSLDQTRAAAENGDPKAAFYLGWCYYVGKGLARDKAEAWKWYNKAASQGVREAAEIRGILEVEAQRDAQSAVLRETIPSTPKRSVGWLLLVCGILASVGAIGLVLHVLNGRPNAERTGVAEDERTTKADVRLQPASQLSEAPASVRPLTLARERTRLEESEASTAGQSSGDIPTSQKEAASAAVVKPRVEPRQPVDPKKSGSPAVDFNEWIERARSRWLTDGNDPYNPNRAAEPAGRKTGQE